jgi:hypothetical protein
VGLRYEAWTLPTAATFERKIADIPVIEGTGSGTLTFSDSGEGTLAVPADYDRLAEIIDSDEGSLIRVYDDATLAHEWMAERVTHDATDVGSVIISGPDIAALMERAVVYPYDYPVNPTRFPDWIWGSDNNLLSNGGFEDAGGTNYVQNPGFESGELSPWYAGYEDGVSATATVQTGVVDTGTYAAEVTPLLAGGGLSTVIRGLQPRKTYAVTARVRAATGDSMQLGFAGPPDMNISTGGIQVDQLNTLGGWEVYRNYTGNNAWQTYTFNVEAGEGQTAAGINIRNNSATPSVFYVDVVTVFGYGVGTDPWQPSSVARVSDDYGVGTFEAQSGTVRTGSYALQVECDQYAGVYQSIDGVNEGGTYTASMWVRNTSGSNRWALELRDQTGKRLAQESVATSTTWQQLQVTTTLPLDLPGNRRQLQVWLVNYGSAGQFVYMDDAQLYEGLPPATVGEILTALMDDATSDHSADPRGTVLTWLDYSGFDATDDSGATAWADEISFVAYRGDTYLNILRSLASLGYEWRIVAKATPAGALTHDLEVYEPDGLGTDYSAASTPAIVYGAAVANASIVKRIPNYTAVFVEGEEGVWSEDEDAGGVTDFGRWERYGQYIDSTGEATLAAHADELLADEASNRTAAQVTVVSSPQHARPLKDYTVGDTLQWQVPPLMTRNARKVQRVTYSNSSPEVYQVTGSRVFLGESGMQYAVDRLLQQYSPIKRRTRPQSSAPVIAAGGGGGMMTVAVAAADASASSKAKADYVCTGVDDDVTIQTAIDSLASTFGLVWLSEGTFNIDPANSVFLINGVSLRGMGPFYTRLVSQSGSGYVIDARGGQTISHLSVESYTVSGVVAVNINGVWSTLSDCQILSGDIAVNITGRNNAVVRNFIGAYDSDPCIRLNTVSYTTIRDNVFESTGVSILVNNNSTTCQIVNNFADTDGAFLDVNAQLSQSHIVGNWVSSGSSNSGNPLIDFTGAGASTRSHIVGNTLDGQGSLSGVAIASSGAAHTQFLISDNLIRRPRFHGILIEDLDDSIISHNIVDAASWGSDNTYDGIQITATADRNMIEHNKIIPGTLNQTRYGINIAASTCDDNVVVGNDLRPSADFGTDAYNDSGTGTVNTYPAHATYGDNFT